MIFICRQCGVSFVRPPSNNPQFCSRACKGLARRSTANAIDFWLRVDNSGGPGACWPWIGPRRTAQKGYGAFSIGPRLWATHRFAWVDANGLEIPPGMVVMHSCDNPICCNPTHLRLGTFRDNNHDRTIKGRDNAPFGVQKRNAKLNPTKVANIHYWRQTGLSYRQIAVKIGVSAGIVGDVLRGTTWKQASRALSQNA